MFYEEKIINGVLCARLWEHAEWTPCNPEQITFRLEEALARIKELEAAMESRS
jgi:hypothetical protein